MCRNMAKNRAARTPELLERVSWLLIEALTTCLLLHLGGPKSSARLALLRWHKVLSLPWWHLMWMRTQVWD